VVVDANSSSVTTSSSSSSSSSPSSSSPSSYDMLSSYGSYGATSYGVSSYFSFTNPDNGTATNQTASSNSTCTKAASEAGRNETYRIVLDSQPISAVTISLSVPLVWTEYYHSDFEDRNVDGWSGQNVTASTCGIHGTILGGADILGTGSNLSKTYSFGRVPHIALRVTFDFVKIDSWNTGESALLYLDGSTEPVWQQQLSYATGTQQCGQQNSNWHESVTAGSVTIPHTSDTMTLLFTTNLDQDPSNEAWGIDNVRVYLQTADAEVTPAQLTFSPQTWDSPQQVVIGAVDDFLSEGLEMHAVHHQANSSDPNYAGGNTIFTPGATIYDFESTSNMSSRIHDVSVQLLDDDSASIELSASPATPSNVSTFYEMRLGSEPFNDVTVLLQGPSEVAVNPASLTFSNTNWSSPRAIELTTNTNTGSSSQRNNGPGCYVAGAPRALNELVDGNGLIRISHESSSSSSQYGYGNITFSPTLLSLDALNATRGLTALQVAVSNAGTLSFESCAFRVAENATAITIHVLRTAGRDGTVSVTYQTIDGSAVGGEDYTAVSGTLIFAHGERVKSFDVPILPDSGFETPDETLGVRLSDSTNSANLGVAEAIVTIVDDYDAGCVSFSDTEYSFSESAGTVSISVSRNTGSGGYLLVNYSTFDGGATSPQDYELSAGYLEFAPGVHTLSFGVYIHNDTYIENPDERFGLRLYNPMQYDANRTYGGAGCAGTPASPGQETTASVRIVDDGDLTWQALASQIDAVNTWHQDVYTMIQQAN